MAYNILGINPFHDGSVCLLSDGKVILYIEEERISRIKKDSNPFLAIQKVFNEYKIDAIVMGGLNHLKGNLTYTIADPIEYFCYKLAIKTKQSIPFYDLSEQHHQLHTLMSFHNSGFNKALGVIIDGGGSKNINTQQEESNSVYTWDYPNINLVEKTFRDFNNIKPQLNVANFYTAITHYLGFQSNQEGKTMGLSSYGNFNKEFTKKYFNNFKLLPQFGYINTPKNNNNSRIYLQNYFSLNSFIFPPLTDFKWHKDPSKLDQKISDLALEIQNECQKNVGDMIEKYINKTGLKNVVCSGGYFLNCVNNYYLTKRFPDVNFYFEPISHDGGTAIGAALALWYEKNQNLSLKKRIKSIYHGPQYSKEQLLNGIQKYVGI